MKLGYANVDYMLRTMTWNQFKEWIQFSILEPFDETRADERAASIVTPLMNIWRDTKKTPNAIARSEFQLMFGDSERPVSRVRKSWEQMKAIGKSMAEAFK